MNHARQPAARQSQQRSEHALHYVLQRFHRDISLLENFELHLLIDELVNEAAQAPHTAKAARPVDTLR